MTTNIYWEPVLDTGSRMLPDALKKILRKKLDGSYGINFKLSDPVDMAYIDGLLDANVDGAEALNDAISNHGEIRIFER